MPKPLSLDSDYEKIAFEEEKENLDVMECKISALIDLRKNKVGEYNNHIDDIYIVDMLKSMKS